jgi:ACS family hexuronate transporter-like MFS transporter
MILPADLFPHQVVGSVAGMVGFGGAMGGALVGVVAGYLLDHGFGYGPVFLAVGTFHVLGYLILLISVRRVTPVPLKSLELVV